jgi:hypothetical protein
VLPNAKEDVVGRFLGQPWVAKDGERKAMDLPRVPVVKPREGGLVTQGHTLDQKAIDLLIRWRRLPLRSVADRGVVKPLLTSHYVQPGWVDEASVPFRATPGGCMRKPP